MKLKVLLISLFISFAVFGQQKVNTLSVKNLTNTSTATFNTSYNGVAKLTSGVLSASALMNGDISASAAIDYSKLASLSTGQILVGNAGVPTATTLSGGATVGATGIITLGNTEVITQLLTGYTSGAGTISSSDSILQAIQKLNGNDALDKTVSTKSQSGTAVSTSQIQTPYNQLTTTATGERLIETGSENMLINGGFESSTSLLGWTNSGSTDTIMEVGTDPDKVSSGKRALQLTTTAGNSLNLYQSVTTPSGIQKQGVVGLLYKSALSTFQVCSLVDGAEQTCVPSANLILDGLYHSIEIPIVFGTTSAGIKVKSGASSGTQGHYIDAAYVRQGIGYQNLALDNGYSAQVATTSGVVANENKDFIASCTAANPTTCTFNTGYFSSAEPNCQVSIIDTTGNRNVTIDGVNATTIVIRTVNPADGSLVGSLPFTLSCQKSGNDYLAASAAVYSASSANYSGRNDGTITVTATTTNPTKGGVVTDRIMSSRYGNRLKAFYQLEMSGAGSGGSGDYLFTLPSGLSFDSNEVFFFTGTNVSIAGAKSFVGTGKYSDNTNETIDVSLIAYDATRFRVIMSSPVNAKFISSTYASFAAVSGYGFMLDAPIAGWSNSSSITGTFTGTPKVPGYDGNVDTFSVSYGNTAMDNACTGAGNCYIDQIGQVGGTSDQAGAVQKITWASTGLYAMTVNKTYTKLKCSLTPVGMVVDLNGAAGLLSCSSCSSLPFRTTAPASGGVADSFGTLLCQGSY